MKNFIYLFVLCLLACKTVDIEKTVYAGPETDIDPAAAIASSVIVEPEIVVLEMPVFVPQTETVRTPNAGLPSVRTSNSDGILQPKDYSHAAIIYEYNADLVYEVFCQPLRVTDICLEANETMLEAPFVADSERWVLGGGVSLENGQNIQHIYIKPTAAGLSASLIINTNRRVYRLILRSYGDIHMPLVRWRYSPALPQNFTLSQMYRNQSTDAAHLDPQFLSFNYRITYGLFKKPYWLPELVFDDGSKTYIRFPAQVLQRELPAVFEGRRYVINYRVLGNLIIIDKLIEEITLKIDKSEITVKKKRG